MPRSPVISVQAARWPAALQLFATLTHARLEPSSARVSFLFSDFLFRDLGSIGFDSPIILPILLCLGCGFWGGGGLSGFVDSSAGSLKRQLLVHLARKP